ncbi:MAG: ribosome assembly cofactor RimP [Bacteroidota bacterium]
MITIDQIKDLTQEYFEGKEIFLVDIRVRVGNIINVFIDGDHGVLIDDCIALSRFIEGSLDRETEDFELTVSTAGLDLPLKLIRQYPRNIGRTIEVTLQSGLILIGKLTKVDSENIEIEIPAPKKKTEGQVWGLTPVVFSDIKGTKVMISFK